MVCPYRKVIVHKPEYTDDKGTIFQREEEEFGECYGSQCPLFDNWGRKCKRGEVHDSHTS